jgi:hypothetical protein
MRVISQGLTSERAYQEIVGDLSAELAHPAMHGIRDKAKKVQLHMLASTFQQKPPSGSA